MFTVLQGIKPQKSISTVQYSTALKRIFAILQWFQKFRTRYLFACFIMMFVVVLSNSNVHSQEVDFKCELLNRDTLEYVSDTTALYPDWYISVFSRKIFIDSINDSRILIEFLDFLNNYTGAQPPPWSQMTGLDNSTIDEYSKIFILDSIARTVSVYPDSERTLELVLFAKDTCFYEQRCRVGIADSAYSDGFIDGVCCAGGDTSQLDRPILIDGASGIRYVEVWNKKFCDTNITCCELVYQYKSNGEFPAKFEYFAGPIKRTHAFSNCPNVLAPLRTSCPFPPSIPNRRVCRNCQTIQN